MEPLQPAHQRDAYPSDSTASAILVMKARMKNTEPIALNNGGAIPSL